MDNDQQSPSLDSLLRAAQDNARRGRLSEAESIVDEIRSATRVELQPSLIIGIMIIEGCIYSYRADWRNARDRLLRARALAASQRKIGLEVEALAWLAYIAFNEGELEAAASRAMEVMRWREDASHFTLYRASSVIAFLYFLADRPESADRWLRFAKRMAELAGAPGATSSIIFAAAALRASSERVRRALDGSGRANLDLELLLSRSAQNYDEITNVTIMPALHKLQEAQVLNMMDNFQAARDILISVLERPEDLPDISVIQAKIELFWARWSMAPRSARESDLEETVRYVNEFLEDDDIIVYSARLIQACKEVGRIEFVGSLQTAYDNAKDRFLQQQAHILEDLSRGLEKAGVPSTERLNDLVTEVARNLSTGDESKYGH